MSMVLLRQSGGCSQKKRDGLASHRHGIQGDKMEEQKQEEEPATIETLEHADHEESWRQLWWTIGVTVTGLAIIAFVYL